METRAVSPPTPQASGLAILVTLAALRLILHCATNGQYGFHRDELGLLDDARYLDWGYVSYPPFTPFVARTALILFGPSLVDVRFFAALAQSIAMIVTGLMAWELGGRRWAQDSLSTANLRSRGQSFGGASSVSVDASKSGAGRQDPADCGRRLSEAARATLRRLATC
jgi:hypothetical protein